jgi:hypothetical protein
MRSFRLHPDTLTRLERLVRLKRFPSQAAAIDSLVAGASILR